MLYYLIPSLLWTYLICRIQESPGGATITWNLSSAINVYRSTVTMCESSFLIHATWTPRREKTQKLYAKILLVMSETILIYRNVYQVKSRSINTKRKGKTESKRESRMSENVTSSFLSHRTDYRRHNNMNQKNGRYNGTFAHPTT